MGTRERITCGSLLLSGSRWVNMNMPEKAFWKNLNMFFANITIAYGFLNLFFCLQWQSFQKPLFITGTRTKSRTYNRCMFYRAPRWNQQLFSTYFWAIPHTPDYLRVFINFYWFYLWVCEYIKYFLYSWIVYYPSRL